jgi:hypothetical protein
MSAAGIVAEQEFRRQASLDFPIPRLKFHRFPEHWIFSAQESVQPQYEVLEIPRPSPIQIPSKCRQVVFTTSYLLAVW